MITLQETEKNRGASVHGVKRVRYDLATEEQERQQVIQETYRREKI